MHDSTIENSGERPRGRIGVLIDRVLRVLQVVSFVVSEHVTGASLLGVLEPSAFEWTKALRTGCTTVGICPKYIHQYVAVYPGWVV